MQPLIIYFPKLKRNLPRLDSLATSLEHPMLIVALR
jgi:hypothetical protein